MNAPANPTEAAKANAGMTDYHVCKVSANTVALGDSQVGITYTVIATITAKSATAAIKAKRDGDGTYVAIPARHLKPVTVKTETVEKVTLS